MSAQMLEVVSGRHNPLVDPTLHVWGWEIPVYLFLGGLAAGLLILTAAVELAAGRRPASPALRLMPLAALGVVSTGMLALFLDLEHKDHVLRFYLAFQPASPMSWGAWILVLVYPIGALFALGSLPPLWRRRWLGGVGGPLARLGARARAQRRTILWASIVAGAGLGVYTGLLLGTLSARPAWNSTILGPLFLASGLSTGAAFMLLFRPRREERERLVRWDLHEVEDARIVDHRPVSHPQTVVGRGVRVVLNRPRILHSDIVQDMITAASHGQCLAHWNIHHPSA